MAEALKGCAVKADTERLAVAEGESEAALRMAPRAVRGERVRRGEQ